MKIQKTPAGDITSGQIATFTIVSGNSSCLYAYFEWYLNDVLVGTGNQFSYKFDIGGSYSLYVKAYEYVDAFWLGGQFYGGIFRGCFSGGTFHYGDLNGCYYTELGKKPKPFIVNIIGKK